MPSQPKQPPARDTQSPANADVAALSYEQARDELVSVVTRLEAGGESLEESLALWERGEALAARCQEWLDGARRRLDAARAPQTTGTDEDDAKEGRGPDGGGPDGNSPDSGGPAGTTRTDDADGPDER